MTDRQTDRQTDRRKDRRTPGENNMSPDPEGGRHNNNQKVNKDAKIRNRYNLVAHLTQDINGKVTNSQLYTTNESQDGILFPANRFQGANLTLNSDVNQDI